MDLLTPKEVAQQLRVNECTVRRWVRENKMRGISLPGSGKKVRIRIYKQEVDKIVDK